VTLENAFGDVGTSASAHDLAIGLLVSWFPILILTSIIDWNPAPAALGPAQPKLNNLIEAVRKALLNDNLRNTYMKQKHRTPDDFAWTAVLKEHNFSGKTGIEEAFVTKNGR
jgi:hypothetical protein